MMGVSILGPIGLDIVIARLGQHYGSMGKRFGDVVGTGNTSAFVTCGGMREMTTVMRKAEPLTI